MEITSRELVLLLPLNILKASSHHVSLHSSTIRMKNLRLILHSILVCDVGRMSYRENVWTVYCSVRGLGFRRWLKATTAVYTKTYLALQGVFKKAVTERKVISPNMREFATTQTTTQLTYKNNSFFGGEDHLSNQSN